MLTIREAVPGDASALLSMLEASAEDQGFPGAVVVDEDDIRADGFGPDALFTAVLAEKDGKIAGFALYFLNYSTWGSRRGLYLEDLYVAPDFRHRGVGRELLRHLAKVAVARGCGRFQWIVHRGNGRAIRAYEHFGAEAHADWMPMSVTGDDLLRIAAEI